MLVDSGRDCVMESHTKNTKNKSKKPRTQTQAQAHHDVPCFEALVRR